MNKKIFVSALMAVAIIALLGITFRDSLAQTAGQNAFITPGDLIIAGFTDAKAMPAANGRYGGAYYFSVAEKAAPDSEAPNLILVSDEQVNYVRTALSFSYTANDQAFAISGGLGREGTMPDGRTVIYFAKGKSYVVIIAPNKQNTEKLALFLANQISAY